MEKIFDTVLGQYVDSDGQPIGKQYPEALDTSNDFDKKTKDQPISLKSIEGLFEVVSTIPTGKPKTLYGSIKLYVNGATINLYVYDNLNDSWRAFT